MALIAGESFRSPLAQAIRLDSAKGGVRPWKAERLTAVALLPATLWLVGSIIAHAGSDYFSFIAWLGTPLATICMILLLIALFYHSALGLEVVVEDYVHSNIKFGAVVVIRFGCVALAVAGIVAVLRITFAD